MSETEKEGMRPETKPINYHDLRGRYHTAFTLLVAAIQPITQHRMTANQLRGVVDQLAGDPYLRVGRNSPPISGIV
ncbi:MAG TPA: hypothetical protein VF772_24840, partial [Terriglobales bacterium]